MRADTAGEKHGPVCEGPLFYREQGDLVRIVNRRMAVSSL